MEAFWLSTGLVALAEMGDKTQLLAFVLAVRFKKPLPIIAGIFVATLLNHAAAGAVGAWFLAWLGAEVLRWVLVTVFLAMAVWMCFPDKLDADDVKIPMYGVFLSTVMVFFLAEMGDKTQIATVALGAKFPSLWAVVAGTTLGMMLANIPAVYLGNSFAAKLPLKVIHYAVAVLFLLLALATALRWDEGLSNYLAL